VSGYFANISSGLSTVLSGMKLTFRHILQARQQHKNIGVENPSYFQQETGIVTLEYPYEAIPVPDHGRYRLHNEIDDCIVCDKCVKICPVDCITIDSIRATEDIGVTSDGTVKKIFAGKFDIDMAKCCFCGLCTTVCPTECLTMTKTYDFSEFDVRNMTYHFSDMTPEQVTEKQRLFEERQAEKESIKLKNSATTPADSKTEKPESNSEVTPVKKPGFKIVMKKPAGSTGNDTPTNPEN
jgi:formate hydrogenlyase subunit 6/NADH:ubiquinone oxidoreductase subunit I